MTEPVDCLLCQFSRAVLISLRGVGRHTALRPVCFFLWFLFRVLFANPSRSFSALFRFTRVSLVQLRTLLAFCLQIIFSTALLHGGSYCCSQLALREPDRSGMPFGRYVRHPVWHPRAAVPCSSSVLLAMVDILLPVIDVIRVCWLCLRWLLPNVLMR